MFKQSDPGKAEGYATKLKKEYPESSFAKTLENPDYLKESLQTTEKQMSLYKTAYEYYQAGDDSASSEVIQQAMAMGVTSFTPNLRLLQILIVGATEDINVYQQMLDQFAKENVGTDAAAYASKLSEGSRNVKARKEVQRGVQYIRSLEEPHYFVMVYGNSENMGSIPTVAFEKFNSDFFKDLKLKVSTLVFNEDSTLTLIADLPRISSALEYIKTFNDKLATLTELRNHKFHSFVITKDNFDILYRTKGLDEYLQFFQKNYPSETE